MPVAGKPLFALTASDLMTAPVVTLPPDLPLREAARLLDQEQISGAPVVDAEGRCVGVETDDGERHLAGEAVLSTIHVKDLVAMAPADAWGDDFRYGVDTYDPGVAAFAAHYLTTEPPRYRLRDGSELTAVSAGVAGWPEDIVRMGRDVGHRGRSQ